MADVELPEILAGPILRRCDRERICVWIATRERMHVEGMVYNVASLLGTPWKEPSAIGKGLGVCVALGKNLFVTLVQIRPEQTQGLGPLTKPSLFPEVDENQKPALFAYDLLLTPIAPNEIDQIGASARRGVLLSEHPELQGKNRVSYGDFSMPTFFLRQGTGVNVLHGSCRKAHGDAYDALTLADKIIKKNYGDPWNRPSALFLTGDQIYADDVADPMIDAISDLVPKLLGWDEKLPDYHKGQGHTPLSKFNDLPHGARGLLVNTVVRRPALCVRDDKFITPRKWAVNSIHAIYE